MWQQKFEFLFHRLKNNQHASEIFKEVLQLLTLVGNSNEKKFNKVFKCQLSSLKFSEIYIIYILKKTINLSTSLKINIIYLQKNINEIQPNLRLSAKTNVWKNKVICFIIRQFSQPSIFVFFSICKRKQSMIFKMSLG